MRPALRVSNFDCDDDVAANAVCRGARCSGDAFLKERTSPLAAGQASRRSNKRAPRSRRTPSRARAVVDTRLFPQFDCPSGRRRRHDRPIGVRPASPNKCADARKYAKSRKEPSSAEKMSSVKIK
jgi:hypothetical protein